MSGLPLAVGADSSQDRVYESDTGNRTPGSPTQSFETQKCEIESNRSDDGDIHSQELQSLAEQNSLASPLILETQRSKIVLGGGSSRDEAYPVQSRKRKREITTEDESDDDEVILVREVINLCEEGAPLTEIESRDRSDDGDVRSQGMPSLAEQNSPASLLIMAAQQSKIVLGGGSNGDEARFVQSRKRKRGIHV